LTPFGFAVPDQPDFGRVVVRSRSSLVHGRTGLVS
jgi:hypothetical protein